MFQETSSHSEYLYLPFMWFLSPYVPPLFYSYPITFLTSFIHNLKIPVSLFAEVTCSSCPSLLAFQFCSIMFYLSTNILFPSCSRFIHSIMRHTIVAGLQHSAIVIWASHPLCIQVSFVQLPVSLCRINRKHFHDTRKIS